MFPNHALLDFVECYIIPAIVGIILTLQCRIELMFYAKFQKYPSIHRILASQRRGFFVQGGQSGLIVVRLLPLIKRPVYRGMLPVVY